MKTGPVVVVTGAGSGIGEAVACRFADLGAQLVLTGRRIESLESTAAHCEQLGATCVVVGADLATTTAPRMIIDRAIDAYGGLDVLVNNAGRARFAPLSETSSAETAETLRVNLGAPLELIRLAAPSLGARRGSVVNIASIGGVVATPNRAVYGASKAALIHATRSLAHELAPAIRINAIAPGPVDTPIYDDLGLTIEATEQLREELSSSVPLGRFGDPREVATWVVYLADSGAGWVTGSIVTIDGGRSA